MSTAPPPDGPVQFNHDEQSALSGASLAMKLAGVVLLLLAALRAADAVVGFLAAPFTSILMLVVAFLTFVVGRALLAGGDDAGFLISVPGREQAHLRNLIKSVGDYAGFLIGALVVLLLVALVRLNG